MFQRPHFQTLQKRIQAEPRRFIQVIYGPRQVGKTTLVRQLLRQLPFPSHYASADAVTARQGVWISQQWEQARLTMRRQGASEGPFGDRRKAAPPSRNPRVCRPFSSGFSRIRRCSSGRKDCPGRRFWRWRCGSCFEGQLRWGHAPQPFSISPSTPQTFPKCKNPPLSPLTYSASVTNLEIEKSLVLLLCNDSSITSSYRF